MIVGPVQHAADHADQGPDVPKSGPRRWPIRSARPRRWRACSPRSSATTRSMKLLAPTGVLAHLPSRNVATLTGKQFLSPPDRRAVPPRAGHRVQHGHQPCWSSRRGASLLRGGRYVYDRAGHGGRQHRRWPTPCGSITVRGSAVPGGPRPRRLQPGRAPAPRTPGPLADHRPRNVPPNWPSR